MDARKFDRKYSTRGVRGFVRLLRRARDTYRDVTAMDAGGDFQKHLIRPDDRVSLVVPTGNRLEDLQRSLPSFLEQRYPNHSVTVSVYACRQGTAAFVRQTWPAELASGRLRVVETPAEAFHKPASANIGAAASDGDYLLMIDSDCCFRDSLGLGRIVDRYNGAEKTNAMSFDFWGQILMRRGDFVALGGYDERLDSKWRNGDDADLIIRYARYFRARYLVVQTRQKCVINCACDPPVVFEAPYARTPDIRHFGKAGRSKTGVNAQERLFFRRAGLSMHSTKREVILKTLRYFADHPGELGVEGGRHDGSARDDRWMNEGRVPSRVK